MPNVNFNISYRTWSGVHIAGMASVKPHFCISTSTPHTSVAERGLNFFVKVTSCTIFVC